MNTVNIKLTGVNSKFNPIVKIDDNVINLKKNSFGSFDATYETDKNEIEITIFRNLELKSRLWWLYALFSFIISIFGIFEPFYDKKNIDVDCKFVVKLKESNEIKINFNTLSNQGKEDGELIYCRPNKLEIQDFNVSILFATTSSTGFMLNVWFI